MAVLPKIKLSKLKSLDDLLTPEALEQMRKDLAHMAKQRRWAEAESRNIPMA